MCELNSSSVTETIGLLRLVYQGKQQYTRDAIGPI